MENSFTIRERERERNSKTLVYKDCSLGSVKTCPTTIVPAKLLMSKTKITGHHLYTVLPKLLMSKNKNYRASFIYKHERVSEIHFIHENIYIERREIPH